MRLDDAARQAAEMLWAQNQGWLTAVVIAHAGGTGRGRADIDDILQEVARRVVQNFHSLDPSRPARPWLRTIAVNVVRDRARRACALRLAVESYAIQPQTSREIVQGDPPDSSDGELLERAMRLDDLYREPLLLWARGLGIRQIAAIMEIPERTVETRLTRARRALRSALSPLERAPNADQIQHSSVPIEVSQ